jgi:transcriptional regulator with GAF, ATPase, and Fis domain
MLESRQRVPAPVTIDRLSEANAPILVGESDSFKYVQFRIEQVAPTDASVLLLGETGTGKGVIAQSIHARSQRRHARFVNINCAALPPSLVESELFGHERGAFTDARQLQIGRFELATGGTIFLDEVGELPLAVQAKLLHVLQERQIERLGSPRSIRVDVRVIAATNRDITDDVRRGRFRSDLYYRLNVVPITLPPLRDRLGDVLRLTWHLIHRMGRKYGRTISDIPISVMSELEAYDWPGNVRELENVLERAVIASEHGVLTLAEPLRPVELAPISSSLMLTDVERAHVLRVLGLRAWRIEGKRGAAYALGLKPSTLRSRMRKLGIHRQGGDTPVPRPAMASPFATRDSGAHVLAEAPADDD